MTCIDYPYCIDPMTGPFSGLLGVLAGFALAGMFLLIDKSGNAKNKHDNLITLLFISFLTGTFASYKFASMAGELDQISFYTFIFPSAIFAVNIPVLFASISILIGHFWNSDSLYRLSRVTTYLLIWLTVDRLYRTINVAYSYYWDSSSIKEYLLACYFIPVVFIIIRLIGSKSSVFQKILNTIQNKSIIPYAYGAIISTAFISVGDSFIDLEAIKHPQPVLSVLTLFLVSFLGAWIALLLPQKTK